MVPPGELFLEKGFTTSTDRLQLREQTISHSVLARKKMSTSRTPESFRQGGLFSFIFYRFFVSFLGRLLDHRLLYFI